jgi:hypothetical protein
MGTIKNSVDGYEKSQGKSLTLIDSGDEELTIFESSFI